jgi:hypothetical protein
MAKSPEDTARMAKRALSMDVDVLCVQEVEDERALKDVNERHLDGRYDTLIVIDGDDPRLIAGGWDWRAARAGRRRVPRLDRRPVVGRPG